MPDYLARLIEQSYNNPAPMIYRSLDIDQQGKYWITADGRVLSVCRSRPHWKAFTNNGEGYLYTEINGQKYYLHRLLALSFNADKEKEKIKDTCVIHHLDFDRSNNTLGNLCILTPEKHRLIHKLYRKWEQCQQDL